MVGTRKDLGLFRHSLLGLGGNAHFGVFHIASNIIIVKGLFFIVSVESASFSTADCYCCDIRLAYSMPLPTVCCIHSDSDSVWVSVAVADYTHTGYVPNSGTRLCQVI